MIVLQGRVHNHLTRIPCTDTPHTIRCSVDSEPRYNIEYRTQQECQDACTKQVVGCNAVNYAPADVGKRYVLLGSKWEDTQPAPTDMYTHARARAHTHAGYGWVNVNFYIVAGIFIVSGENISMPSYTMDRR